MDLGPKNKFLVVSLFLILSFTLVFSTLLSAEGRIRLATTTSVENSRLLEALLPFFTKQTRIPVDVIAVGSGAALTLGKRKDVDILLVHAPSLEKQFMLEGYGIERVTLFYNDYLLVGPVQDPANVKQSKSIEEAFTRIARAQAIFISRGDSSGTHQKELEIWNSLDHRGRWKGYKEGGQGMEATLRMAHNLQGYTLTDRGTWSVIKNQLLLTEVYQNKKEPLLQNPYSLILIHPNARVLFLWFQSPATLHQIASYSPTGEPLYWIWEGE